MIAFTMMVAAAYVGTTIALRRYFDDERFNPSDVIAVEDDRGER